MPDPDSLPSIPGYELARVIGRGGMGVVYLARQTDLNRPVALKMLLASAHVGAEAVARFRAEAEAVARFTHPNIVQVYAVGEAGGCPFIALEYVEGESLAKRLDGVPQPPASAAELVRTLAGAVQAAHVGGVVHRDLKPANILLTPQGEPKVADFGLSKQLEGESSQTVSGSILGTPSYMAPEQAAGRTKDVGPAADVYALGAILYEALTGRPPFRGATVLDTLEQVRTQEPVAPSSLQPKTPRDLETICLKCLQKDPARRYATAQDLADDLGRFLRSEPILARSVTQLERLVRWRRRNPTVAALLAFSTAVLVVGLVVSSALAVLATRRADRIEQINADLVKATKESEVRGEVALKTLEVVIQDIQTELANVPNAQKLRGRLLGRAMDGIARLDETLRAQKRVDRNTALALLNMAEVFRQVGGGAGPKGPATANQLYERAIASLEALLPDTPDVKSDLAEAYLLFGMNLAHTDDTGWEVTAASSEAMKDRPLMKRGLEVHRRAADLRRELLAAKPDDPAAKYELARALTERAYQEVRAGDAEGTRQLLESAHRALKPLVVADPDHADYRAMLAKCSERLGDWYFDLKNDLRACEPYYKETLDTLKRLAESRPADVTAQVNYANAWFRWGDLLDARGDKAGCLAAFQQELAITQKLEKAHPDNVQVVMDCSISYDHNYRINFSMGRYETARDMVRKAFDMRLPLVDADPDNRRLHSMLLRTTRRFGSVCLKLNQTAEAVAAYDAGLKRLDAFIARHPNHGMDKDLAMLRAEAEAGRKQVRPPG